MDDLEKIQETNWWRVCKLLIEVGTEQLLHLFENAVYPLTIRKFLVDNKSEIEQHRKETHRHKKKLNLDDTQFTLLYFEKEMKKQTDDELDKEYRKTKIGNWDITLITCLLYYFCCKNRKLKLTWEQRNIWNKIRNLRNNLHAHIKKNKGFKMTDSEYKEHWQTVTKVLRDLNKFTPQINIEKKIESIQKETVVDGDKLKAFETFDNWVQCEMDILEKLNQMEEKSDEQHVSLTKTVNDGVTTVTDELKKGVIALKQDQAESQHQLAEIKHLILKQGAEATDRVPKKMHKGEERLSSQVFMDAEPDEGKNPIVETQTLPASSGNTAADGESVLANLLPKMTVNEPDESRDESASSLQSNLLTEQRSHNEMPPTIGYIDCLIFYRKSDRQGAIKFKEHLINDIKINKHGPVVALLYDDPELSSLPRQEIEYFEEVCKLSTFIMLYMTNAFFHDPWERFKTYACLMNFITNKSQPIVPVYTQEKEIIDPPSTIRSIRGYYYYNNNKFDRDSLANHIEGKVETRVERNERLEIEKQQRRDKEIVDSHPQQDAFVQTSGQTPGTSAGIQEVNTIPDLEEDTTDDVDLASSSHDDKMEQKEEAQVASLAEIKQKKKKKKKKKTRR